MTPTIRLPSPSWVPPTTSVPPSVPAPSSNHPPSARVRVSEPRPQLSNWADPVVVRREDHAHAALAAHRHTVAEPGWAWGVHLSHHHPLRHSCGAGLLGQRGHQLPESHHQPPVDDLRHTGGSAAGGILPSHDRPCLLYTSPSPRDRT